jgi:uncharacterized protein (TIGR00299 family) protein
MNVAYFDCIAGASGDMLLGSLVDAGLPMKELNSRLSMLGLGNEFELRTRKVDKNGFVATKLDVIVQDNRHGRHLAEIEEILSNSQLPKDIREKSSQMFRRLAGVEAGIHGKPIEEVHLHEVGGTDTIIDIVGTLFALDEMKVERVYASPLPLGRGFIKGAHGQIPLPAPATVALLKGIQIQGSESETELVTPTGAVLLSTLSHGFGPIPAMTLTGQGYGAGGRDLPIPNIMRVLLGEMSTATQGVEVEALILLETNIDDNSAEINGYVMEKLFEAGALDVTFTPIQMKKNRPASQISVLCTSSGVAAMENILFLETSTLGVRRQAVERSCLARVIDRVDTPYGRIRVKVAYLPDGKTKRAPEYEDCKKAALSFNVTFREVYNAALNHTGQVD